MPRNDGSSIRKLAEEVANDEKVQLLRLCYTSAGGSDTDFITDIEGPVALAGNGKSADEIATSKLAGSLRRRYLTGGNVRFPDDLDGLVKAVRERT